MSTPSTLRSRHVPPSNLQDDSSSYSDTPSDSSESSTSPPTPPPVTTSPRISLLSILRLLGGLLLLSSTLSYLTTNSSIFWNHRPAFTRPARLRAWLRGPLRLSDPELALYNGSDPSLPILLALNGSIYDVSAGRGIYGPGGMYHFFAGRDATRAFVTGCFEGDLTPDLRGVEEMFVPVDEEVGGEGRAERKMRRKREVGIARRRVRDTVAGWEKLFDGGRQGAYFRVGRVKREEGWEERLGPVRELCEKARRSRVRRGRALRPEEGGSAPIRAGAAQYSHKLL